MSKWQLNIGFRSNAQSLESATRQIRAGGLGFARILVDDVALTRADELYDTARRTLSGNIHRVVMSEIARMAALIGRTFALPDKYTGPNGQMTIREGMSQTARNFGFQNRPFDRQSTGIKWAKRSPKYLRWKRRLGWPRRWWEMTGKLADSLSSPSFYTESFGPVRVSFHKTLSETEIKKVTISGQAFRPSREYQVGQLRVSVMNRITPQDLPSLLSNNPSDAVPNNGPGLARMVRDDDVRTKLLTTPKGERTRYALEPFVSFYMTRAIPNAVWRRTERLIRTQPEFLRQSRSGFKGVEDYSA